MPATLTYPGVYIEEIPSGVRTIVGVSTSIAAFLGRAVRGPVDDPITVNNFGDFERTFGGLAVDYPVTYAVRDFFLNGGSEAVIVRLYNPPQGGGDGGEGGEGEGGEGEGGEGEGGEGEGGEGEGGEGEGDGGEGGNGPSAAATGYAVIDANGLSLHAASPGTWADSVRARIDHDVPQPESEGDPHPLPWVDAFGLTSADLFNLTVRDSLTGATETFLNVTVKESPRQVGRVLEQESQFVRAPAAAGGQRPGADSALTNPATDPVWTDDAFSSPVSTPGQPSAALDQQAYEGSEANKTGLFALEDADLFNLLCIPPDQRGGDVPTAVWSTAAAYCERRRAMLIIDPPSGWRSAADARDNVDTLGVTGTVARNAALYFPRIVQADPLLDGRSDTFVPCGVVAGVIARTDTTRGVWKAPAGTDAALRGTQALAVKLTDDENGMLNPLGINSLRSFRVIGRVVWGARTRRGADQLADEYKYIPVRRLALYIEESLFRGTKWVVFEPNDEPLWAQIRLNIGAFMRNLFRQGAFQGSSPREAYFVKVDSETTTQNEINLGIVNIVVGFAPLKPAEFVVLKIQQIAGQIEA